MEVTSCSRSRGQENLMRTGQGFMLQKSFSLSCSYTIEALCTGMTCREGMACFSFF